MAKLPKPHKKRWYKRFWIWLIIVIAASILIAGILGAAGYKSALENQFSYLNETIEVQNRQIQKTITTNGKIAPDNSVALSAAVGRKVTEVNVSVGDEVNVGDRLMRSEGGAVIDAPFDGRVLEVNTFVGDVPNGTTPSIVVGFRSNHIALVASESEVVNLRTGQHASLSVPSYNDGKDTFDAEVQFVDEQKQNFTEPGSTTVESGYLVKISAGSLPDDIEKLIGLNVDVVVDVYETDEVRSIEPGAIQYDDNDTPFVYLPPTLDDEFLTKAATAEDVTALLEKRYIETGFEGDDYIEVTSGLNAGESVLLYIPSSGGALF